MNTKEKRYNKGFEKLSKKLRLIYPCVICGEKDFKKLELHNIDENKNNDNLDNILVLCKKHHRDLHNKDKHITFEKPNYKLSGISVTVARGTSSVKEWFNSTLPLKILIDYHPNKANEFRKRHIKGFISIGGCNYYIAVYHNNLIIGILGFSVADYGEYDLLLKADTTPQDYKNSTSLLLYVLRTKEVKKALELKFNRKINTVYSMAFSRNKVISRYRKHAKKIQEKEVVGGYNLGYLFELGTINTIKEAKSLFKQKYYNEHKKEK